MSLSPTVISLPDASIPRRSQLSLEQFDLLDADVLIISVLLSGWLDNLTSHLSDGSRLVVVDDSNRMRGWNAARRAARRNAASTAGPTSRMHTKLVIARPVSQPSDVVASKTR